MPTVDEWREKGLEQELAAALAANKALAILVERQRAALNEIEKLVDGKYSSVLAVQSILHRLRTKQ